ncbi:VRR-NUC domain-containing protein [Vibrio agarivorans]|uniref:VRR-NUC domain-containing protein n=1 Tax=Vibrio agarivorans TaxID=153622 RepID=UPI00222F50C6|nr:VRR-NUC domain-containing protein [Vibrio agarivorans]
MTDPVELAPDYYLHNFFKLTQHATEFYPDFLTPDEHHWIEQFHTLNHDAQCLLVRLLSRKGQWFRSDKLNYAEIGDLSAAMHTLAQQCFISVSDTLTQQDAVTALLTKPELCEAFPLLKVTLPKSELLAKMPDTFTISMNNIEFIELQDATLIHTLLTLFFANTRQDLSQFVLDDIGVHQFENYALRTEARYFQHRSELEALLVISQLKDQYYSLEDKSKDLLIAILNEIPHSSHPSIQRKGEALINTIARDLERLGAYQDALTWFAKSSLPPARERQARIFDKLDDIERMASIVTSILDTPYNVEEQEIGEKLQSKLARKQKIKVPRATKPIVEEDRLCLDLTTQRVELAAKSYYESQGWQVFYSENLLLNGLFGLAFWDVVFADIDKAFVNRYQHRPLDLYHADFTQKRATQIEEVLTQIRSGSCDFIVATFKQKQGIANPFVHWKWLSSELIEQALKHIPSHTLAELFTVFLSDIKLFRTGMPDLILFNEQGYRWVEVKGPGDKLQDNQWRWIKEFQRLEVPVWVCWVEGG